MNRTRVKICGITRPEDARAAIDAGADALGLVFYPPSPRAIEWERAARIAASVPALVSVVGLFVDPAPEWVETLLARVRIDVLQFHGDESPEFCAGFGRPWMKALRMRPEVDLPALATHYSGASALLLDSYQPGLPGGTGSTFDWGRVPRQRDWPLILAGGLAPDNVAQAIVALQPYAVDVSGGVEGARKGIKDARRIQAFMQGVRDGDAQSNQLA